jgi:hypothetical protein
MQKRCIKCQQIKPLEEYYKHPRCLDGHSNKCKSCTREHVKAHYHDPEVYPRITEYERKRARDPVRRAKRRIYMARHRANFPGKWKARYAVDNAIRDGRLTKQPCEVCGSLKVEGHHSDYRKKLDVRWFCRKHHSNLHMELAGKIASA